LPSGLPTNSELSFHFYRCPIRIHNPQHPRRQVPPNLLQPARKTPQQSLWHDPRRKDQLPALAAQNLRHDRIRNCLYLHNRWPELAAGIQQLLNKRRARPAGVHDCCPHLGRAVVGFELLRKALVEGERGGFCARVVDHPADRAEARHAGGGDDVAVVRGDHGGYEFFDHEEVRDGVHFKDFADGGFRLGDDGASAADAGVVKEYGRIAVGAADGGGEGFDAFGACYVAFVEVRVLCWGQSVWMLVDMNIREGTHVEELSALEHQRQRP
jgi:hypothetical protein